MDVASELNSPLFAQQMINQERQKQGVFSDDDDGSDLEVASELILAEEASSGEESLEEIVAVRASDLHTLIESRRPLW